MNKFYLIILTTFFELIIYLTLQDFTKSLHKSIHLFSTAHITIYKTKFYIIFTIKNVMSLSPYPSACLVTKTFFVTICMILALGVVPTTSLKLTSSRVNSLKNHHEIQHHLVSDQLHTATVSSASGTQLNYNQQILKLEPKQFALASNINDRVTKVNSQYLGHEREIKLLATFQTFKTFSTEQINCNTSNPNTLQALLWRTTYLRKYLENSLTNNEVNFIQAQEQRSSVRENISQQLVYLRAVQILFDSGCLKKVKVQKSLFVSNPNANNWILGDWTYQQFIDSYIHTMNKNQKVSKCPLDKPFFDGNQCVNCRYPNNVWDMRASKCTSCPYSLIVNIKTRRCVSQIRYVNNIMDQSHPWITARTINQVQDDYQKEKSLQNSIICPFYTPFILNEKCSSCPEGLVYFLQERKCVPIPYNMNYDPNLHKIVERLQNYQVNTDISSNIKEGLFSCPAQFPYYDNITCLNCQFPYYFNQRLMTCEKCSDLSNCPPGHRDLIYTSNSLASPLTGISTAQVQRYKKQQQIMLQKPYTLECPVQFPFYYPSAKKCASCPSQTPLFNITNYMCASCPPNSNYNSQTYLCQGTLLKTNSQASGLLIADWQQYQQQYSKLKGQECPIQRPYSSGNRCITCPSSNNLFDTTSQQCTHCPEQTVYNQQTYQCEQVQFEGYKSNSKAVNFWTANQILYLQKYQKSQLQECPEETPFSVGKQCITCKEDEIFNTSSLECSTCPSGTVFNALSNNCTTEKAKLYVPGNTEMILGNSNDSVQNYLDFFEYAKMEEDNYDFITCNGSSFSTKKQCIQCEGDNIYFNVSSLECTECLDYDQSTRQCRDELIYLTNIQAGQDQLLGQVEQDVGQYSAQIYQKLQKQPQSYRFCPQSTPFFSGQECISCAAYFNVKKQQCQECQQFQQSTLTCKTKSQYLSNLKTRFPYITQDQEAFAQRYEQQQAKGTPICPFDTPFYDGNTCIQCSADDEFFNLDSRQCDNCGQGQQLNQFIWKCQEDPTPYYTSLESKNLLYAGQPRAYFQYKNIQSRQAGGTQCPEDKPYYKNECGVCPSSQPLFNLLTRQCTNCPQGSEYNQDSRQCQTPIGDYVTPETSLEKSFANLFT